MKSHTGLFEKIVSFDNVCEAARLARRGKMKKPAAAFFEFKREPEILRLIDDLMTKRYRPGVLRSFRISEPKERLISRAPFRDRVVHHAIHNVLEPIFDPTFIHDSYATRKGKGAHAAIRRFQHFARGHAYVLKCDIRKYFPSVDPEILMGLIEKKNACRETLSLIRLILDWGTGETPLKGLPIGNLTSQFFANIYLNGIDHFVKEKLHCRAYLRYMDDSALFANKKEIIWDWKRRIMTELDGLNLKLHENKCRIYKTRSGTPFLGMVIAPDRIRIKRESIVRFKRRLRNFTAAFQQKNLCLREIGDSVRSWLSHAAHADSWRLRSLVLRDFVLS
jgi:retron-type reverse transcriptase